ncbi:MAG: RecB family exonuclease [Planctomycetota bacterium]
MKKKKPYLSNTQLDMIERCPAQYERRYVNGEKIPPGITGTTGIATHGAAASEMTEKVETKQLPPIEKVRDTARDEFAKAYERGVLWQPDEIEEGIKKVKGRELDRTVALASAYHDLYAPKFNPVPGRIEWKWRLETDLSHDLLGVIDLETEDVRVDDEKKSVWRVVRDLKTSKRTPPQSKADSSSQLTMYALAHQAHDGKLPDAVALDYLVPLKKGVQATTLESFRTEEHIEVLWSRIDQALRVIKAGLFSPAPSDHPLCNEKFCGYAKTCPFFYGRIQTQVPKEVTFDD